MATAPLLEVKNLRVEFPTRHGTLVAIDDLSLHIDPGEILGVVGESGAGKSMTGAAIIGLLEPPGRIASGEIVFDGQRIDNLPDADMRRIRGRRILTVQVLDRLPDIHLSTMPRMGDFAEILAAVDAVTGWQTLPMFEASQTDQQREVLDADEVATAVVTLLDGLDGEDGEWTGTATGLLEEITIDKPSRSWPKTPSHLSGRLKRATPALAVVGASRLTMTSRNRYLVTGSAPLPVT